MTVKDFETLVAQALDHLPEQFARKLDNVEIVVEIWPPPGQNLFGLYRGIPQTKRGYYAGAKRKSETHYAEILTA